MKGDYNLKEIVLAAFEHLIIVDEKDAERKPAPDKWSAKEIMGHLIDSASNNHGRFVRAQGSDDLIGQKYNQDEWVTSQNYQAVNWQDLLILWRQFNLHISHIMHQTPDSIRDKERPNHNLQEISSTATPGSKSSTLGYLMEDYVLHLKHHLGQVREVLVTDEE